MLRWEKPFLYWYNSPSEDREMGERMWYLPRKAWHQVPSSLCSSLATYFHKKPCRLLQRAVGIYFLSIIQDCRSRTSLSLKEHKTSNPMLKSQDLCITRSSSGFRAEQVKHPIPDQEYAVFHCRHCSVHHVQCLRSKRAALLLLEHTASGRLIVRNTTYQLPPSKRRTQTYEIMLQRTHIRVALPDPPVHKNYSKRLPGLVCWEKVHTSDFDPSTSSLCIFFWKESTWDNTYFPLHPFTPPPKKKVQMQYALQP